MERVAIEWPTIGRGGNPLTAIFARDFVATRYDKKKRRGGGEGEEEVGKFLLEGGGGGGGRRGGRLGNAHYWFFTLLFPSSSSSYSSFSYRLSWKILYCFVLFSSSILMLRIVEIAGGGGVTRFLVGVVLERRWRRSWGVEKEVEGGGRGG